jgi:hypothetical protein
MTVLARPFDSVDLGDMIHMMEHITMREALEHLRAALVLLDAEGQHAAAAQLDHLIHQIQVSIAAASGAS